MRKRHTLLKQFLAGLMLLGIGLGAGYFASQHINKNEEVTKEVFKPKYSLLANRIQTGSSNEIKINFTDLRASLEEFIISKGSLGSATSLYFEYLPVGTHIEINQSSENVAASLMKLPIVMDTFKASELGLISLDTTISLKEEWLNDSFGDLYLKGAGHKMTIKDLTKEALVHSDNTAIIGLGSIVDTTIQERDRTINALDVEVVNQENNTIKITPYSYSTILKCLYFSCMLNPENSQTILQNLSVTPFNSRLRRYLPGNVKVAHKIGTYSEISQSDCGIVYVPNKNYLICIMVAGDDEESSEIIAETSKLIYDYIVSNDK